MRYGDHETRTLKSRRREGFRPRAERLEPRELMAIDLANIAGGASTTAPGPYGVLESGLTTSGGAGFSVAAVGDNLVLAMDETSGIPGTAEQLSPYFEAVSRGALAPLLRGSDTVSVRRIWVLRGYRGGWPQKN